MPHAFGQVEASDGGTYQCVIDSSPEKRQDHRLEVVGRVKGECGWRKRRTRMCEVGGVLLKT
jgi:hypothetical protein